MTDRLTPESLGEIENTVRCGFGGPEVRDAVLSVVAAIRRLWAEREMLLSMMPTDTCPYETHSFCPFTPGDDCRDRDVMPCWEAWSRQAAEKAVSGA